MVLRLRFRPGPAVVPGRTKNQRLALAAASLLAPTALAAWMLAIWKIASDLKLAGPFGFGRGLLVHWQFWLGIALALTMVATKLNRFGRPARESEATRRA
jgi:hypothetical protein